jgi:nicotinamide-nucleotide amidase
MPSAEIIAIGTELLLGEIQDTNTRDLALFLRAHGIDLYRTTIVGDNVQRIANVIRDALTRADIIITSGGLGPTVDDPTRDAVALAVHVSTEFQPMLWQQIQARFERFGRKATENNRRQAFIPQGALPVENKVGTAPAFIVETNNAIIISLPGVPRELQYILENEISSYLNKRYDLRSIIKARVLHTAGVGESQVDEWIGEFETSVNPTVGLLAHPGQTDIRITAKAETRDEVERMLDEMTQKISEKVGDHIYGIDEETLENSVLVQLKCRDWKMVVVDCGLEGELSSRFKELDDPRIEAKNLPGPCTEEEVLALTMEMKKQTSAEVALCITAKPAENNRVTASLTLWTPKVHLHETRSYGGSPLLSAQWAANTALDFVRRNIE